VLVPEGLIEFICEIEKLIGEINQTLGNQLKGAKLEVDELFEKMCTLLTPECA
jgi:hypothetical protein